MLHALRRDLLSALVAVVVVTLVLGLGYPLLVTGIGQVAFPGRADGSLVTVDGKVVGSRLLGQRFKGARWFHSRPSQSGYSASATFFSNAGPNGADTRDAIAANARAYLKLEGRYVPTLTRAAIPPDAVQTSASGVDPHISVANARIQAHRVAAARDLPLARVEQLIDAHTDGRGLGVFGEPGVNVLGLNLALEARS
ncbi:MAG: potassium-transporting ATPase subunit KdpC [Conexibacter sp.]